MPLTRNARGELVFPGRIVRRKDESFIPGDAFPTWLAAQAGTATFAQVSNGTTPGRVRIATAATTNAGARLWVPHDIRPDMYTSIEWTVQGLRFDTDTPSPILVRYELGQTGADKGVAIVQTGDGTATLRGYQSSSVFQDTALNYSLLGANGFSRSTRNITLCWLPGEGLAYVLEDDQVVGKGPVDTAVKNQGIRAMITMATTEAVSHYMEFSTCSLVLRHD